MSPMLIGLIIILASMASLWFSTLTYSLRELSRPRLAEYLGKRGSAHLVEPTIQHVGDLIFVTALGRLLSNMVILLGFLRLMFDSEWNGKLQYVLAVLFTLITTLFCSVAFPSALAKYAGNAIVGFFAGMLHFMRMVMSPVTKLMHATDTIIRRATKSTDEAQEEHVEQEILAAVKEGEREGVVDEAERRMIEAVIAFGDTTVNQVMTARPEMIGIGVTATLEEVKHVLEEHGLSRLPVHEGTLDKIVGVLYARDLLVYIGEQAERFDLRKNVRQAFYVPETRTLRDVLDEFRNRKIHMAIVLDEYGGTSGLVTIEDVLEELVGEISDEHEPAEPAGLKKVGERSWEVDARKYVGELNHLLHLDIPEDEGYDTLGGFIITALGHIPEQGEVFHAPTATYLVLEAEPQKINRVRIDVRAPKTPTDGPPA